MTINLSDFGCWTHRKGCMRGRLLANENAALQAVADPMPDAADAIADRYHCDIRTINEIADSSDIDAVVICTPTDMHADLIEQFRARKEGNFLRKTDRP